MRDIDSRRLSPAIRQRILDRDSGLCGYCLNDAEEIDHIMPWSYRHNDSDDNLIAACWLCNHIASNKMFSTLAEKKEYILGRRERIFRDAIISVWTEEELADMGPGLRTDIRNNCIVVYSIAEGMRVTAKIRAIGLEVRFGDY